MNRPELAISHSGEQNMASLNEAKFAAIYVRVSSSKQDHKSQMPDLERWAGAHAGPVRWFKDKFSGKTMNRPGWSNLESEIQSGNVSHLVCWKIDRLGRTTVELLGLVRRLMKLKIELIAVNGGFPGLGTAEGRLMFTMLAACCEYDNEIRSERVRAGQAVAKAAGKKWGGSKPGIPKKVTAVQVKMIREGKRNGETIVDLAAATGLSRPTVYAVLGDKQAT
jgi:DNA invertase Pin-like site-specific DNA recombinase